MERDSLVYAVIGHAMAAHRELGPGLDETFYHRLLAEHLKADRIEHRFKPRRTLEHRGFTADVSEPDLALPGRLVLELKVLTGGFEPNHFLQLKGYLKLWRIRQGLLFDFGKESLVTRSYFYDDPPPPTLDPGGLVAGVPLSSEQALARRVCECVARLVAAHGFGYRDTTYRGLLVADLRAEGMGCMPAPKASVRVRGRLLGEAVLSRLVMAGHIAVLVLSQRDRIHAADRAVLRTALRLVGSPLGVIVHFGKTALQLQWVLPAARTP